MRIKICGITDPKQGQAIADYGATDLGFICVKSSPRYIRPLEIQHIVEQLPARVGKVGVFAGLSLLEVSQITEKAHLTAIQLHGNETPEFCQELRQKLSDIEIIKAFRVKNADSLAQLSVYSDFVDTILLDAYHPQQLGGTGKTIDWSTLNTRIPDLRWFLAGGLSPDNITEALSYVKPDGIDLSSGVERSPGNKDLTKVVKLLQVLKSIGLETLKSSN